MRNHGHRGLSGPAGSEENFEIAAAFVHSERAHDTESERRLLFRNPVSLLSQ